MTVTTFDKSKHLLELGLDPDSADMYYTGHRSIHNPKEIEYTQEPRVRTKFVSFDRLEVFFPAWSLDALLGVMRKLNATITLQIIGNSTFLRIKDNGFIWQKDIHTQNPMDAVYGGMLWLFEQGLIRKEDKK
jgi:hypothetical protein